MSKSLVDRFWAKVQKGTGCWEWTGSLDRPYAANPRALPYGNLGLDGGKVRAHRFSWELHFGPIPSRMKVLHNCDNAKCVRPDHLRLGTQADNIHDMASKGRRVSANLRKTHCPLGHPYEGKNLYRRPDGQAKRDCLTCRRERARQCRIRRSA